jgi:hypothetical protein
MSYESLFIKKNAGKHIDSLVRDGTWLDDDAVTELFGLLAWQKGVQTNKVRFISPCITKMLMEHQTRRVGVVTQEVWDLFQKDVPPLLFVPICHAGHWSLLYLRNQKWWHMDSLGSYHRAYSYEVMRTLKAVGCLDGASAWDGRTLHQYQGVPRQPGSWQCATYVLLFMLVLCDSIDERDVQRHIEMCGESYRRSLVDCLINLLLTV